MALPADLFGDGYTLAGGRLFQLDQSWKFDIKNTGKVEVKELNLEVPFEGVFITDLPESKLTEFNKAIPLGTLRARKGISVTLWTKTGYYTSDRENIYLTHAGGMVPVQVAEMMYGRLPKLGKTLQDLGLGFALLLLFMFAILAGAVHDFVKSRTPQTTTATTTSPATQPPMATPAPTTTTQP